MAKAKFLSLLLVVCVVAGGLLSVLQFVPIVKANPDWLAGWTYRKSHIIQNATGAGTNYQVNITVINGTGTDSGSIVYINNKTRSDFGDIRFTNSSGTGLLDCWMETLNTGVNATFWFEVADDLSTNPATIYVYYGNSTATTTSNGGNTFLFFDDFSEASIDWTNKWQSTSQASYSIESGKLKCLDIAAATQLIQTKNTYNGFASHSKMRMSVADKQGMNIFEQSAATSTGKDYAYFIYDQADDRVDLTLNGTSTHNYHTEDNINFFNVIYKCPSSGNAVFQVFKLGTQIGSEVGTPAYRTDYASWLAYLAGSIVYVDDVFIRKYVTPEPAHGAWGSEETGPTYSNIGASTLLAGQPCTFSCLWADETNMSGYIFGTNNTGTFTNESWTSTWSNWPTTTSAWANVTKTLNATAGIAVQYEWWANDTNNNWNNTGIQSLIVGLCEYYNTGYDASASVYVNWFAQTFTVGVTAHTVTSVKLLLGRSGSPGTVTVSIRTTDGTHPNGTDLTNGTTDGNTLPTGAPYEWREITLTELSLNASTKYAIVVRALNGNATNTLYWFCDITSPTYAGGNFEDSTNSGGTWASVTEKDFMFEVWSKPSANTAPTISSASGTNWDDTDNCYAQKKTYTVSVTYSDADGFGDIRYCELYLKTGGNTTRAEFAFLEDTNTWSSPAGSTQWSLTGQSNSSSGTDIAVVWGFQAQWDATEESDLDFLFFVNDTAGASVNSLNDTNFDVVTRLVTSGFTSDDSRINIAGTTTINGTVYYANDPASNTSSASYPPDAEFTQVDIHDSGHVARGTDTTIVNGAFSASFAIPNAVQSNTYHVYINLADADGTDQDALDGDTTAVIGDRIKVNLGTLAFEDPDGRVNVGTAGIFSCTAQSEYDGHVLGAGDSLVLSGYTFTYNGTYWVNSTSPATPTSVTINSLTSVSEATYGITVGNINANSATGKWDRVTVTLSIMSSTINVGATANITKSGVYQLDGSTFTGTINLNDTVTKTVIGYYGYTTATIVDGVYGITVFQTNSVYCVFEQINITLSVADSRINAGENATVLVNATYSYYGTSMNGTVTLNDTTTKASPGLYNWTVSSITETTYGLTAFVSNATWCVFDNLTVFNLQPVQYLGSGDFKYQVQIKYGYDGVLISGGYADLAYPNGTVVGKGLSNATGWVTFIVGQLNSTNGAFNLYGENETAYAITYPGVNQTFTIYLWTLAPQDVSGNSLTSTTQTVSDGATTVWTGTAGSLYIPAATFNVSISWLQNLSVNSTLNVNIATDTTTNFTCTCYPYVIGGTRYWAASNATILSSSFVSNLLTVEFSGGNDSYVLVASCTTRPAYVLNVTYDYTAAFASGYLVMPHFGNVTIVASYENWGGLYVKMTDHPMWSLGWVGQRLNIVANGTVGNVGEIDVYCIFRGQPVSTSGFTVTSYVGGTLIGLYAFTDTSAAVSLEWAVVSSGGPIGGPTQAASLFITLAFTFPETVQSGATVDGFLNVSWIGAAKVYIWSVIVDANYAKDWELQIARLPWTLETLMENGQTQVPVVLYITGSLAAGSYSVPCDVTFQTVEGVSKTVRSVLTFEVTIPVAEVPSTLVYVFLGGLAIVVISSVFTETKRRKKYSQ